MILVKAGLLYYQQTGKNAYGFYTENMTCVAVITVPLMNQNYDLDKKMLDNIAKALSGLYQRQVINLTDKRDCIRHGVSWKFEGNMAVFRNSTNEKIAAIMVAECGMVEHHIMGLIRMVLDLRWYGKRNSTRGQKQQTS